MGDHEQGAAKVPQPFLKPVDHFVIQMIGGLVKYQQVAGSKQGCSKQSPLFLPAGERGNCALRIVYSKLYEHGPGFALFVPVVRLSAHLIYNIIKDRFFRIQLHFLRKIGYP